MGAPPPRPRRADLHRPARPHRACAARLPSRPGARGARAAPTGCAPRTSSAPPARSCAATRPTSTRTSRPVRSRSRSPTGSCSPTPRRRRSRSTRTGPSTRGCASSTARSTCAARACARTSSCATAWCRRSAPRCEARDFLESRRRSSRARRPRARATSWSPRRTNPGSFFALPQSPQLFKQLLMIGGLERYYQIARCFRDEDSRADRQLEFTQLDLEMSFVEEDDVIEVIEGTLARGLRGRGLRRRRAAVAADDLRRGDGALRLDRPDTRFGLEISDLGDLLASSEFKVFAGAIAAGGVVRGLNAGARELPRSELDALTETAQALRGQGAGVGLRPGGRHLALADRQVPLRRGGRRRHRAPRGQARRPDPRRRRHGRRPPRRRWARCAWSWPSASRSSPRAGTTRCGSSTSRCSSATRTRAAGTRCTTRSPRRAATSTTRRRCARAATT